MKRLLPVLLSLILLFSHTFFAFAQCKSNYSNESVGNKVALFEDGSFLVEGKVSVQYSKSQIVSGSKPYYYYDANSVLQWTAVLSGSFSFNGSTSFCTGAACSTSVQNGNWNESANNSSYAGNSAFASVTMVRKFLFIVVQTETVNISLTCDANGNLT